MATAGSGPQPAGPGCDGNATKETRCFSVGRPRGNTDQTQPADEFVQNRPESRWIDPADGAAEEPQPGWAFMDFIVN